MIPRRLSLWLGVIALLWGVAPVAAQGGGIPLAYTNPSGQLVIIQPGSEYRWIVSNPGETLLPTVPLAWNTENTQLLFGVEAGENYSLRVADTTTQAVDEIATGAGVASGGSWVPAGVLFNTREGVVQVVPGSEPVLRVPGGALANDQSVSTGGDYAVYRTAQAVGLLETDPNGGVLPLPGELNSPNPDGIGIWAGDAPLAAYWTTAADGRSELRVVHAPTQRVLVQLMTTGVPVTPLAWVPGEPTLLYLSAEGVLALDAACLLDNGCANGAPPPPISLLPANTQDIGLTSGGLLAYTLGGQRFVAPASCLGQGDCGANAVPVGAVQPRSQVFTAGDTTAFTTGGDGAVALVDLPCALNGGGGCAQTSDVPAQVVGLHPRGGLALGVAGEQLVTVGGGAATLGAVRPGLRLAWGQG